MIESGFLEEVMKRTDIVSMIGSQIQLNARENGTWSGLCPFHRDYKGTLLVSPAKRIFKCFVCKKGGDALKFVMFYQKKTFPEAVAVLAEKAGMSMDTP